MGSKSAIGIGNGICFKQVRDKGGGSYIDPLVRDSIVGLWKFDQNTNESPTRNIIKNTIKDKGGDLELLNFGYKLNSGYNGYVTDFTEWKSNNTNRTQTKITVSADINFPVNLASFENATNAPSFRIKVSGLPKGQNLYYTYINEEGLLEERFYIFSDGIYTLPATAVTDTPTNVAMLANEQYNINIKGLTIEQLPLYEGALVTDGKDDMIVSQKTVQEMGITNKITVVSMIHQIDILSKYNRAFNNYIRNQNVEFIRNNIARVGIDKTGIYGYTWNNSTKSIIENILGDKDDYSIEVGNSVSIEGKFSVEGYIKNGSPDEISGVAVYWTFIANKVLTTDEINQIIGYYKLDKYVTPQVIYDVKRQGLTNDTSAADWYLKDFSGNGHDMQLYNFAKSKNSGIGKYAEDFLTWLSVKGIVKTSSKVEIIEGFNHNWVIDKRSKEYSINSFKASIKGIPEDGYIEFAYFESEDATKKSSIEIYKDGDYFLPNSTLNSINDIVGFRLLSKTSSFNPQLFIGLTVEQIPDYEGALVSDGKDDYGKAEGLPIFKDYTVAADYARLAKNISSIGDSPILSKSMDAGNGAFIMNSIDNSGITACYSFGAANSITLEDIQRKIYYQSKHSNQGKGINARSAEDGTSMWLDTIRDNDTRFIESAFYSMLLFPYSLSEFLLERQLKRYKLGTLYPDMVEFRPIINVNIGKTYNVFEIRRTDTNELLYYYINGSVPNNKIGSYLPKGTNIRILVKWDNNRADVTQIKFNGKEYELNRLSDNSYYIDVTLDKSP